MPNTRYQFEVEARNEQNKISIEELTIMTENIGKISLFSTKNCAQYHSALDIYKHLSKL